MSQDLYAVAGLHRAQSYLVLRLTSWTRFLFDPNRHQRAIGMHAIHSFKTLYDVFTYYQVAEYIAECARVLEKTGLPYKVCMPFHRL